MIEKLQHRDIEVSKTIRSVFQLSYAVEAKLLNATDFPPLKRSLHNYVNSPTQFFGYIKDGELAGVIEIEHNHTLTSIHSLVVHPKFFRQGIAKMLMEFIFNTFKSALFEVETGLANEPAKALYKTLGFKETKQWDTDHGIRKIKFERRLNH
ncbi:acetyltransferase (GNAT) family protein [Flavobacteriaceae bacterium MAR_2010_72]|nr:acetyltransferase (GNAT) family protein [Flavobacteriaceae bacterium MAR_2010_72]TVZ60109.1 acetyltransferase (GNAT) family protein [Flavobacteriaceae bacterium MAR_2010_105]